MQEMLDFCGKNNIACDIELIRIQKVNEAYEQIVNSDRISVRERYETAHEQGLIFSIRYSYASEDGR